jgi:hypothetical protein
MLHVITACSTSPQLAYLTDSAALVGLSVSVLHIPIWKGYVDKIRSVRLFLDQLPETDIVCFVDAFDVLAFADATEIIDKFRAFECDVVISAELSAYPEKYIDTYKLHLASRPVPPATRFNFVNSGGYIGYVYALRHLFAWRTLEEIEQICVDGGDQSFFTEYYFAHAHNRAAVQLDESQTIFQCVNKVELSSFEMRPDRRVRNTVLDQTPCFMHFNGFSGYSMQARSLETGECEDVRDIFPALAAKAALTGKCVPVYYRTPFNIIYKGVLICDLPQL